MDAPESAQITEWLRSFEQGDEVAAMKLWECYFQQVCNFALKRTRGNYEALVDPEDIAASVFESLWRGATEGRLGTVADRNELRMLLLSITKQKVVDGIRRETAKKRGGGKKVLSLSDSTGRQMLSVLPANQKTPSEEASFREEFQRLLDLLDDEQLIQIAVLKLQGHTNQEICEFAKVSIASVTRKLRLIKDKWIPELES